MATFVKTPCGHWKAVIRRRGWPATCRTFRLKRDARDWACFAEDGIRRRQLLGVTTPERMLFSKGLDRYLREITPTKRASTQVRERYRSRSLRRFFGRYELAAVTPDLIARYRDLRLHTPVRSPRHKLQPPAAATVGLELALLRHLFVVANREWRLGLVQNPVDLVTPVPPAPGRERRLERDEEIRLFAALAGYRNPMLGWIVRIAIETGMRAGEIAGLRLAQVDLQRRVVRLGTDTKTAAARTIPLTRSAAETLRQACANPKRPVGSELVFFGLPRKDGTCSAYRFRTPWWKLKSRLGMADLHFHDLRHEAISRLVEAGLSDQQAAAISGHKSMQMLKRYTHLRAVDLVEVLDTHLARRSARMRTVSIHAPGTDWQNPRWSWLCLQTTHAKPASTVPVALPGPTPATEPILRYGCYSMEISGDWPPTTGGGEPSNA